MKTPAQRISLTPGKFKGLSVQKVSNSKQNLKAPKLGGAGIKAPSIIANALGISKGMPVHQNAVNQLMTHPDTDVVAAAKRLLAKY